jgi:hypothetical protein
LHSKTLRNPAKVCDVREEFDRRYVVDESDPVKAANAKRMAFKRALDHLSPAQFAAGSAEGADWIWRITDRKGGNGQARRGI